MTKNTEYKFYSDEKFEVVFDWFVNSDTRLEMSEWMSQNIKHHYTSHHRFCDMYCFDNELDAMAFKLRWS